MFISYSSADRSFVRDLNKRLKRSGYDTWLDEHELVAGDALSTKIAEGVRGARVVLVVVSASSVRSRWLKYELNLATGRMVKGECRVIPLVVDDSELPAEVLGLLYADFRSDSKYGFKSVRTALEHENTRAVARAAFWVVARDLVREAFGGSGHVSLEGDYADRSYEILEVEMRTAQGADRKMSIVFDTIPAHGQRVRPLNEQWWADFESSMSEIPERLCLFATQRPVEFNALRVDHAAGVSYRELSSEKAGVYGYAVFIDCSIVPRENWSAAAKGARELVTDLAQRVAGMKSLPLGRDWSSMLTVWTGRRRRR